ncbi:MAG: hypothetical protein RJB08_47, partial [Actinomycetota bacterium]
NTKLQFPEDQESGKTYEEGKNKCNGKDATLKAYVWDQYDNANKKKMLIADFDNIRIKQDGMVVVLAFVADDTEVPLPESAVNLPQLGAADKGGVAATTTTAAGATATTVAGETTTTAAGATTTAPAGATTTSLVEAATTTVADVTTTTKG